MSQVQASDLSGQPTLSPLLHAICDVSEGAPNQEEKTILFRGLPSKYKTKIFEALNRQLGEANTAVKSLGGINNKLHEMVQKLTENPLHVATFKCWAIVDNHRFAWVFSGGEERLVSISPDVDTSILGAGVTVFLSAERNTVLSSAPDPADPTGQLGKVADLYGSDGVIVCEHDVKLTLGRARWLLDKKIKVGDEIIWCPRTRLVLDLIESDTVAGVEQLAREFSDPPPSFAGYNDICDDVINGFTYALAHPETASRYGITPADSTLLLFGPSGCGKTLLARNLAHEIGAKFFVINASAIYSPWVGESEQRLIEVFRKAQQSVPSLVFIDEVDAIGRVRGSMGQQHSDRVASVLLTQMDGAAGSPGIGIIGACNRVDLLDTALRSRFGKQYCLRPPNRNALRSITEVHLKPEYPYQREDTRERCVDALVHRFTSPNADNVIATLRFRDGKTRTVNARDLLSGRSVQQIVTAACDTAFKREVSSGLVGIEVPDVDLAVENTIVQWRDMLCVDNVRGYLNDLPDDVDVVSVNPVVDPARPAQYLQAAP